MRYCILLKDTGRKVLLAIHWWNEVAPRYCGLSLMDSNLAFCSGILAMLSKKKKITSMDQVFL